MADYFVSMFFNKRKRIKTALKITLISILALFVLYIMSYIANVFILSYAINNTFAQFKNDSTKINYEIERKVIKSSINIKDLKIEYNDNEIVFDKITISKKSGILFPSSLNININNFTTKNTDDSGFFKFVKKGNKDGFTLGISGIFGNVDINHFKVNSITKYVILEKDDKEAGEITINYIDLYNKKNMSSINYDIDFIARSITLAQDPSMVDKPFNIKTNMITNAEKDTESGYKEGDGNIYNIKFDKVEIDASSYKISLSGETSYGEKLSKTDLDIVIENDNVFLRDTFNILLKRNTDNLMKINKMYNHFVNKLVPKLKRATNKSTNKTLFLKIYKEKYMPEILINNISSSEILKDLSNDVN